VTDLASAVSALGVLGIQNPLPVNVYAVQGLLQGTGGVQGMFNQIPGLFNTNFANSHVYTPTGTSFESTTLIPRAATSIAGTQALAGQLYQSMSDRLNAMVSLQARIGSGDLKDAADINARLTAEQAYIQAQLTQATTLAMMQKAAFEDIQQQREEKRQQDIDAVIAANPDR
jgi:type IV secretion system protein VirB5